MSQPRHEPVLVQQVVELFQPCQEGVIVDCTVGLGGHAAALLQALPQVQLLGLDVDGQALEIARENLAPFGQRVHLRQESYHRLASLLDQLGLQPVGVLFDLGVSSLQLSFPQRGFSFRLEGPLDMRFSQQGPTLAEILAQVSEGELTRWLALYGEEKRARAIARAILRARNRGRLATTVHLREAVWSVTGPPRGGKDPATRTFQALRIVTNQELAGLAPALEAAARRLRPGGRLVALSYHSLEDRIVKTTLRALAGFCQCPPGSPSCTCQRLELLSLLTKKPLTPTAGEVAVNPRARSAKLRAAERRA
jgi:16S rRNA (cytosine1402-N4)-methyltransferase